MSDELNVLQAENQTLKQRVLNLESELATVNQQFVDSSIEKKVLDNLYGEKIKEHFQARKSLEVNQLAIQQLSQEVASLKKIIVDDKKTIEDLQKKLKENSGKKGNK